MSTTYTAVVRAHVEVTQILSGGDVVGTVSTPHTGFDFTAVYDGTTYPDVTAPAYDTVLMSGGSGSIDLTTLRFNGFTSSLSGKNPRALLIQALSTNSGDVTVAKGASNGYTGLGSAFSVTLKPGMPVLVAWPLDNSVQVDGTHKVFDLTGTGTDGVQVSAVGGT